MFERTRWFLAALSIVSCCVVGCGEDKSAETASADGAPAADAGGDAADADSGGNAADSESPSTPAADAATVAGPITDVAIAPSAQEKPEKSAFIFYSAKDGAAGVMEFHKKDLEAKGWKLGRNDVTKLPGSTTLSGAVQQYEKGSDVLTVVAAEQMAETPTTSVCVMDIPLPPTMTFINPYGGQGTGDIAEPPAQAVAWFTKELTARGWKADAPKETGGTHAVNFRKGQRTLSTQFRDAGAGKKGSTLYFMHMG